MIWYTHFFKNFPQFVVVHIVKGFSIVNEAEVDVFLRLSGHEFEQAPGVGNGQGSLVCCSPWGCKESDMNEQLN